MDETPTPPSAATATNIDNQISLAAGAFNDAAGNTSAYESSYDVDSVSPVITGFDAWRGGDLRPGDDFYRRDRVEAWSRAPRYVPR